jgi:hypothetical protein
MKRFHPLQTFFGCWALVLYVVCVLNRLGFTPPFFDSMNENALIIGMFLAVCVPFGYAAIVMSRIGLSTHDEAPRELQRAVLRRMRQTWIAFPFSSTAVLVGFAYPVFDAVTVQLPKDHPQALLLISAFDLIPIFLCFRFLPSDKGRRLIRKWMREEDR